MKRDKRLCLALKRRASSTPIFVALPSGFSALANDAGGLAARWATANGFKAKPGRHLIVPAADGSIERVLLVVDSGVEGKWSYAAAAASLPAGDYHLEGEYEPDAAALGWALGSYRFDRYRAIERKQSTLQWPAGADRAKVMATADATFLVRDLITTPANDMGPVALAKAARDLGRAYGAKVSVTVGDKLLDKNYPLIHAVGRAAEEAPRLVDMRWGSEGPEVVLVGKGVCFDTGGLDLKPAAAMKLMKKDMGGAAHVLGVASMIMALGLPVRLRVLIPCVENSVAGNAFRPLDVIKSRKGLTVEIGNTDAEGRLVLCDALAEAGKADLIVDFATLTGAARVALGAEVPVLFSNDDAVAAKLLAHADTEGDPLYRLPLHRPYRAQLKSPVADLNNAPEGGYGGAITAALFLEEFVTKGTPWCHIDVMAYNTTSRPGRPAGGEAMGMRAVYELVASMVG